MKKNGEKDHDSNNCDEVSEKFSNLIEIWPKDCIYIKCTQCQAIGYSTIKRDYNFLMFFLVLLMVISLIMIPCGCY